MTRRIGLLLAILFSMWGVAVAQSGGQLCVRSFEDRNGNGNLDAGEPLLTRGVSVNLLDANGVTIASALLDESPTAAQGVVCFQFLDAGQYSVAITSADYTATTVDTITTNVTDGSLPTVIEYGGQRAGVETVSATQTASTTAPDNQLVRILVAALSTLVVVTGMVVLGVIVYFFAFRGRRQPTRDAFDPRVTTGSMSAVRARDTSEVPKV